MRFFHRGLAFPCVLLMALSMPVRADAQINTERMMTVGRNALYYEDYVLSIQYFNRIISAKPYLYEPYFYRGIAKLSLEDYAGAEADCSRSIEINPYFVRSYEARGLARISQGRYSAAIDDYVNALRWETDNRAVRHNLILCYLREDRMTEAQCAVDTLLMIDPEYTPAMAMQSHLLLEKGDTAGAAAELDRALAIDRYDASLYRDRAMVSAMGRSYEEAERLLDQALKYAPEESGYYVDRALVRYYRNNLRGALSDYDIAVDVMPSNIVAHYNRGILRSEIGDDNRAIEDFDMVIDAEPDNMMAIFNRGLLRDRTGDFKGAIADYSTVLDEYPGFIYGYQLRSVARYRIGDRKGGEQDELVVLNDRNARFRNSGQTAGQDDRRGEEPDASAGNTRKSSDRNVWNYRKIVTREDEEGEFVSEYRGKVQNRNFDVRILGPYHLTWFGDAGDSEIGRSVRFSASVESVNTSMRLPRRLQISNRDVQLDEIQIKELFNDVDRQTELLSHNPDEPSYFFARALDFYLLQDFSNAESDFTNAILTGNGMWAAYFGRALVRIRMDEVRRPEPKAQNGIGSVAGVSASGRTDGWMQTALNDLTKVIDLEPDFAPAYYDRGNLFAESGDYRSAYTDYSKAIALDGDFAEAYYNRGLSLIFMNRIEEGLSDLGKAGELGIYTAYNVMKRFSLSDR